MDEWSSSVNLALKRNHLLPSRQTSSSITMNKAAFPQYKLSGNFSPNGLLWPIGFGLGAVIVLGALYALATYFIPFIYILFLFTIGCGAGVGALTGRGLTKGHVRSRTVALTLGLVMGIAAAYFEWIFWLYLDSGRWIWGPVQVIHELKILGEHGVWSLKQWTPTGNVLYGIWALEAAVIIGMSALIARDSLDDEIYCEHCKKWLTHSEQKHVLFNFPEGEMLTPILQGEWQSIKKLKPYKNTQGEFLMPDPALGLSLKGCSSCENLHLLSLIKYIYSLDSDGDIQTREEKLIDQWLISKAIHKEIAELYS